jgi:uncharacterized protein YfiM (DUF2279 family)
VGALIALLVTNKNDLDSTASPITTSSNCTPDDAPRSKARAASAAQGFRLSTAQTVSSSGSTSFGFFVSGIGRSGGVLGRRRSITDWGSSRFRTFVVARCKKNRSS